MTVGRPACNKNEGTIPIPKRDEYLTKAKYKLDELDGQIDEIEAKVKKAKDDAKQEYKYQLANVRRQYREVSAKLDELKAAAGRN